MLTTLNSISIQTSYTQAANQECWKNTMNEELCAICENRTWDLVPSSPGASIIGNKWVYSIKSKVDGIYNDKKPS